MRSWIVSSDEEYELAYLIDNDRGAILCEKAAYCQPQQYPMKHLVAIDLHIRWLHAIRQIKAI